MWKVCGIKIEPANFFHGNFVIFLVQRSVPKNFQRENFSGQVPTKSLHTQDSENIYESWIQQMFHPVLVAGSWVSATKWGRLAKL